MSYKGSWAPYIIRKEVIVSGRAQYMILEKDNLTWGLLNIYAPNQPSAHALFWETVTIALPNSIDHWIVGGDFNMLETPLDRVGGSSTSIHRRELATWERLIFQTRILDAWHLPYFAKAYASLQFSRSSGGILGGTFKEMDNSSASTRTIPHNVSLSQLDRFYLSDHFCMIGGK